MIRSPVKSRKDVVCCVLINLIEKHARYNYFDITSMDVTKMTRGCKLQFGLCNWEREINTELYCRLSYDVYVFVNTHFILSSWYICIFHLKTKTIEILHNIKFWSHKCRSHVKYNILSPLTKQVLITKLFFIL